MKLQIQFLQQAIRNNNTNIVGLADRVSNSIIEQIDNLSYIASEFSNFAKMPDANPEEIEVGELLNRAAELYSSTPLLNLNMILPDQKIYIISDRSQMLSVITNLLENAKQAVPAGRHAFIEIKCLADNAGSLLLSIKDNGSGIADDVADHIFQPYFTTKTSGTGLGLAMTRRIVEFWKGEIWFETQVGEGTTFFIRLPISYSEERL
jgi:signal transduction histidine kinase